MSFYETASHEGAEMPHWHWHSYPTQWFSTYVGTYIFCKIQFIIICVNTYDIGNYSLALFVCHLNINLLWRRLILGRHVELNFDSTCTCMRLIVHIFVTLYRPLVLQILYHYLIFRKDELSPHEFLLLKLKSCNSLK